MIDESFSEMGKEYEIIGLHWRGGENDITASKQYLLDNLEKIYPMNSYITKIGFVFREEINVIDCINVNLSLYGHSNCPKYLRKIIQNIIKSKKV